MRVAPIIMATKKHVLIILSVIIPKNYYVNMTSNYSIMMKKLNEYSFL